MSAHTHPFQLDHASADVVVHGDAAVTHRGVATLTCADCGMRLAWLPNATGGNDAAHGITLDAMAQGRIPRCEGARHA